MIDNHQRVLARDSVTGAPGNVFHAGDEEPGNGSRYVWCVWRIGSQWFAAFPDFGGASRIGSGRHYPDYVREKFRCSNPDAEEMTRIINRVIEGTP